jgi:hypothetical protein
MVLDWSNQGAGLVGVGETGAGPIKFNITKTPEGYSVGIYSGQNLLATEAFASMEEARSWSEQAFSQIPTSQPQSPTEVVSEPVSMTSAQMAPQAVRPTQMPTPMAMPSTGLGASKDSGLTTSRIAAASLGGKNPVTKPSGSFKIVKPSGGPLV